MLSSFQLRQVCHQFQQEQNLSHASKVPTQTSAIRCPPDISLQPSAALEPATTELPVSTDKKGGC